MLKKNVKFWISSQKHPLVNKNKKKSELGGEQKLNLLGKPYNLN